MRFSTHGTTKGYVYNSWDLQNIRKFRRPDEQAERVRKVRTFYANKAMKHELAVFGGRWLGLLWSHLDGLTRHCLKKARAS